MENGLKGFWRGRVVKHLECGLLKVFIPGVYPDAYESDPDKLPDAEIASPLMAGGAGGNGVYSYPDIDAVVWCFFMNDDINFPVVFAQTLGGGKLGYKQAGPNVENGKNAVAHCINAGKSQIFLHEGGDIRIKVVDKGIVRIDKEGDIFITSSDRLQVHAKTIKVTADENLDVQAKNINVRSGEGVTSIINGGKGLIVSAPYIARHTNKKKDLL